MRQTQAPRELNIASESVTWLLDMRKTDVQNSAIAADFFFSVFDLTASRKQPHPDKVMASCTFKSDGTQYNAVAELRTNDGGQQELLTVRLRPVRSKQAPLLLSSDAVAKALASGEDGSVTAESTKPAAGA